MDRENDNIWNESEEEKDLGDGLRDRDEIGPREDEEGNEEDDEAFQKIIDVVESHDTNLLFSGAGMYLLGMSFGWTAFRVVHTRKALRNYKKILSVTTHSLSFPYGEYEVTT